MVKEPSSFFLRPSVLPPTVGILLVALEHGAGLRIVDRDGPEIAHGRIGGNVQLVGLGAVEGLLLRIDVGDGVVGTLALPRGGHGRRDGSVGVVKHDPRVGVHGLAVLAVEEARCVPCRP